MNAPLEQSLRATSIQSILMFAQSAAHALTFVRQKLSAFLKQVAGFYSSIFSVIKESGLPPKGSPLS